MKRLQGWVIENCESLVSKYGGKYIDVVDTQTIKS